MCVDELLVKDSHSYQADWVGFDHQATVMAPRMMTAWMKDYWYYLVEVVVEMSILPSADSIGHFASYLEEGAANWRVYTTHYFGSY